MLKEKLLLATLLFLMIAPEPDSKDIADMTANFIVPTNHTVLMASDDQTESVPEESANLISQND
jgi:hypothetical protein